MTPWTVALQTPLSMGILQARILECVAIPSSRGSFPNPGIQPSSFTLQADSLLPESRGKPKNTGVGSLSLLQGNFPNQELNWGLLPAVQEMWVQSWVRKIPWRRKSQPTAVFLPGKSHGQRSLMGLHIVHGVAKSQTRLTD